MERRNAGPGSAALLASALAVLCVCVGASSPAAAQEVDARSAADRPLRVTVTTEGVYGSFRPRAVVSLSRDAHVAVFEVEPGVGALKLYPYTTGRSERRTAGSHQFDLSGVRASNLRDVFHAHLGHRLRFRAGHHPDAYLLAVASERPLELSELASGRVFAFRRGGASAIGASAGEVATALLDAVVAEPGTGTWDYDLHAYSKLRSPGLAAGFGAGATPFGDLAAFGCLTGSGAISVFGPPGVGHFPNGFDRWSWGPRLAFGFGTAARHLPVALSPVSYATCRGFGFTSSRIAFGLPRLGWPYVFGPHRTPHVDEPEEEPEILDATGITVGEPRPADPRDAGAEGWTRAGSADSARQALLERVADARRDGEVTVEEVSELVRDARLGLPRSLPDRMRIEAFRRHRVERERAERFGRFGRLGDRPRPADRGFSFPGGVQRGGDRPAPGARRPAPSDRPDRPDARRPSRPSVDRPSPPRRGGTQRPRKVKEKDGT